MGRAFVGHGEYIPGTGNMIVPEGTFLKIARDGRAIQDITGRFMEAGNWKGLAAEALTNSKVAGDITGMRTLLPGSSVPNYTLSSPSNPALHILENSTTIHNQTLLSDLLGSGMGYVSWAACTK
ncbi:putative adhesin [uncultured Erythrobacter sp.]|uniref:putative adhesin n=1 Tax=uncultured Erythrobacter sp. TaxID=263913 RepID=UPI003435FA17